MKHKMFFQTHIFVSNSHFNNLQELNKLQNMFSWFCPNLPCKRLGDRKQWVNRRSKLVCPSLEAKWVIGSTANLQTHSTFRPPLVLFEGLALWRHSGVWGHSGVWRHSERSRSFSFGEFCSKHRSNHGSMPFNFSRPFWGFQTGFSGNRSRSGESLV